MAKRLSYVEVEDDTVDYRDLRQYLKGKSDMSENTPSICSLQPVCLAFAGTSRCMPIGHKVKISKLP